MKRIYCIHAFDPVDINSSGEYSVAAAGLQGLVQPLAAERCLVNGQRITLSLLGRRSIVTSRSSPVSVFRRNAKLISTLPFSARPTEIFSPISDPSAVGSLSMSVSVPGASMPSFDSETVGVSENAEPSSEKTGSSSENVEASSEMAGGSETEARPQAERQSKMQRPTEHSAAYSSFRHLLQTQSAFRCRMSRLDRRKARRWNPCGRILCIYRAADSNERNALRFPHCRRQCMCVYVYTIRCLSIRRCVHSDK